MTVTFAQQYFSGMFAYVKLTWSLFFCIFFFLFRHYKQNGNICCGSKVFDPHNKSLRCCSDHLYSTSSGEVECCGNLLLEKKNQICCSSSTLAIKYVTKSNHHCCGHYYYNTSIWSCCAEHLKPTPERHIPLAEYRPKPLMELIPDICHKTGEVSWTFFVLMP